MKTDEQFAQSLGRSTSHTRDERAKNVRMLGLESRLETFTMFGLQGLPNRCSDLKGVEYVY